MYSTMGKLLLLYETGEGIILLQEKRTHAAKTRGRYFCYKTKGIGE